MKSEKKDTEISKAVKKAISLFLWEYEADESFSQWWKYFRVGNKRGYTEATFSFFCCTFFSPLSHLKEKNH